MRRYSLLAAPIYLSEGIDREVFLSQEIFEAHFKKCKALDAAVLVVGDISSRSYLISTGLPREVAPEDLTAAGAVGDLLGRFLDRDGAEIAASSPPAHDRRRPGDAGDRSRKRSSPPRVGTRSISSAPLRAAGSSTR